MGFVVLDHLVQMRNPPLDPRVCHRAQMARSHIVTHREK